MTTERDRPANGSLLLSATSSIPCSSVQKIITKALGVDSSVKADYYEQTLHVGDGILLCSDGLSNIVTDAEMLDAFRRYNTPERVCDYLLNLALDRGARDNVSVVLVKI